ncbi:hypothetical protein BJ875DRAFT_466109 [Amylocarpus encephaloides]|uniref:Uncharacterized protein n=1 Tax=Amylocarpus encephaloides TaxID=45428 RepID=A0A9P7YFZ1_9HELO|nr:hypothetical protein BJ875DRAFT_466109 [Amylocarpus encephaloides]
MRLDYRRFYPSDRHRSYHIMYELVRPFVKKRKEGTVLDVNKPNHHQKCNRDHLKFHRYLLIFALSQVNRKVRRELCESFWRNIELCLGVHERPSYYPTIAFFKNPRNILPSIKKLRVGLRWLGDFKRDSSSNAKCLIATGSNLVNLEEVTIEIKAEADKIRQVVAEGENAEWVRAFIKMDVWKLKVRLRLNFEWPHVDRDDPTSSAFRKKCEKVTCELENQITNILIGPTKPTAMTKQEAYIAFRTSQLTSP